MNHFNSRSKVENTRWFSLLFIIPLSLLFAFSSSAQLGVDVSDATADPGDQVEVDVTVNNFERIISMQYSVNWDPEVIDFDTLSTVNDLLNEETDFATPNQTGDDFALTVSWFTQDFENGDDLPDGTVLFTVVFDVVGEMCDETPVEITGDPSSIEVIQSQEGGDMEIPLEAQPGLVNIPGNNCNGGDELELIGSMETAEPGEEVCIQISVENFDSVLSMQYVHSWDLDVLEFVEVRNTNLNGLSQGSFNFDTTFNDLRLTWNDPGGSTGVSVPDGTVIYELCFNVVGSIGDMTEIDITSNPEVDVEIIQVQGGSDVSVDPAVTPGKVNVEGSFDGPIITAESGSAATGSEYCMDVTVQNFDDIETVQFSLGWDSLDFDYINLENLNTTLDIGEMNNFNTASVDSGELSFFWATSDGMPKTLEDGAILFTVCFDVAGDCDQTTTVNFTDDPTAREISTTGGELVDAMWVDAEIDIPCFTVPFEVADLDCNGECDGSIDLMPQGGEMPYDFDWSNDQLDGTEDPQNLCAGTYQVTITENGGTSIEQTIEIDQPEALDITLEGTTQDDGSGNGSIDLTIQGGTGSLTIDWSGPTSIPDGTEDPTGLMSGQYTVTVTDENGCVVSRDIFVQGNVVVDGAITPACADECTGSIDVSVSGGTPDYDFEWDGPTVIDDGTEDPSELCPGMYSVTVTDEDGTTSVASFDVGESDPVQITVDDVQADDDGMGSGSISLTVDGGTPGYDYSWSGPTAIPDGTEDPDNLLSGTYTVTVTDANNCTATLDITVDPPFSIAASDVTNISCTGRQDGAIDITVAGGEEPYSYSWSNGSTNEDINTLPAGDYTVTVTDDLGDVITATFTIIEPEPLNVMVSEINGSTPGGQNGSARATVSGGTPPYSYDWSSNETDSLATMLPPGNNIVIITDSRGCSIMDSVFISTDKIPIDCYSGRKVITPNGDNLNDRFLIECNNDRPNTLRIFNQWGQKIYEQDNYDNSWRGTDEDGEEVDENTYLWVLEVQLSGGDTKVYRGAVTVLRNLD